MSIDRGMYLIERFPSVQHGESEVNCSDNLISYQCPTTCSKVFFWDFELPYPSSLMQNYTFNQIKYSVVVKQNQASQELMTIYTTCCLSNMHVYQRSAPGWECPPGPASPGRDWIPGLNSKNPGAGRDPGT